MPNGRCRGPACSRDRGCDRGAQGVLPDCQRQRRSGFRRWHRPGRRFRRRKAEEGGISGGRDHRDRRPSGDPRRVVRDGGRADDPGLRPLRRAAARPDRKMDDAALRADRPRRSALCPWGIGRQGTADDPDPRRRSVRKRARRPAGQSEDIHRGRGGIGQSASRPDGRAAEGAVCAATPSCRRTARCGVRTCPR